MQHTRNIDSAATVPSASLPPSALPTGPTFGSLGGGSSILQMGRARPRGPLSLSTTSNPSSRPVSATNPTFRGAETDSLSSLLGGGVGGGLGRRPQGRGLSSAFRAKMQKQLAEDLE
jgi:hypothetical protein